MPCVMVSFLIACNNFTGPGGGGYRVSEGKKFAHLSLYIASVGAAMVWKVSAIVRQ